MNRDKAEKFVELANKRVNKAIKDLRLIGNLSNKQNYEFSEEQAKKIVKALQVELDSIRQNFLGSTNDGEKEFRL